MFVSLVTLKPANGRGVIGDGTFCKTPYFVPSKLKITLVFSSKLSLPPFSKMIIIVSNLITVLIKSILMC